jgi:hypothetical protein
VGLQDRDLLAAIFDSSEFFPKFLHLSIEFFQAAIVLNHVIRKFSFLLQTHLRGDGFLRIRAGNPVSSHDPLGLSFRVAGDEDHRPERFMEANFEQQGDFIDDDGLTRSGQAANFLVGQRPHARMNHRFEFCPGLRIFKDDFSELGAIKRPVFLENFRAECVDDLLPRDLSRLYNFPRQFVGVDDRRAEPPQDSRYRAFPRRDAAGQSDEFHGSLMANLARPFK